jgi:hypothetical protein
MEYHSEWMPYPQLLERLIDSIPTPATSVVINSAPNYNLLYWWKLKVLNVNHHSPESIETAIALIESQTAMSRDSLIFQFMYVL